MGCVEELLQDRRLKTADLGLHTRGKPEKSSYLNSACLLPERLKNPSEDISVSQLREGF